MAIIGVGIDTIEVERVERALTRPQTGVRFRARVFTDREVAYCESRGRGRFQSYAARFAAKEAAFKALGTGWQEGIHWLDVEVVHRASGKPDLVLTGRALEVARELRVARMFVSLSHSDRYVVAVVIFEADS